MATVTLHNWLLTNGNKEAYAPQSLVDFINPSNGCILLGLSRNGAEATNLFPLRRNPGTKSSQSVKEVREEFQDSFYAEGAVSWQWMKCFNYRFY